MPGVGDVTSLGNDFGMRIWLNPEKLAALNIAPADVTAAITEQNLEIAAGTIGGNPQPNDKAFEYSVLQTAGYQYTLINSKILLFVLNPATGNIIYLKDIARVELRKFNYGNNAFVEGKPATFLLIFQAPGANALETYAGITKALTESKKHFPRTLIT